MTTYAIGDIHGCYDELMQLLDLIRFNPQNDQLWLTGDLINRGPESLKTIRFIKSLGSACISVLGNHDIGMLVILRGTQLPFDPQRYTFHDIKDAPDREELLNWLEHQPLLHYDPEYNFIVVHAGLHPRWDLQVSMALAKEVQAILRGPDKLLYYPHFYGNTPTHWDPTLEGFDRIRFIINTMVRMRYLTSDQALEFKTHVPIEEAPADLFPWFQFADRKTREHNIIFGHWSSLEGKCSEPNVFALDTGCVWGGSLTALRIEDQKRFSVACQARATRVGE